MVHESSSCWVIVSWEDLGFSSRRQDAVLCHAVGGGELGSPVQNPQGGRVGCTRGKIRFLLEVVAAKQVVTSAELSR